MVQISESQRRLGTSATRPLPKPTSLTEPFWQATKEGRLLTQRCAGCGKFVFRPEMACPGCFGSDLEWVESSGRGEVYSFSIVHRAPSPAFEVPYVVAIVELEEGWHLLTHVVGCEPDEVRVGLSVRVSFVDCGEVALPFFVPDPVETEAKIEVHRLGSGLSNEPVG